VSSLRSGDYPEVGARIRPADPPLVALGLVGKHQRYDDQIKTSSIFQEKQFAHNLDVTYVTVALICLRLYFEHQVPRHEKLA
jgi:hypothetical protein